MVSQKPLLSTDSLTTDQQQHSNMVQDQVLQFSQHIALNIGNQENFPDRPNQYTLQNRTELDLQSILNKNFEIHRLDLSTEQYIFNNGHRNC